MKIQATIDGGDGAASIEWHDGAVTVSKGGSKTSDLIRLLSSGTISSYLPRRGGYSGFDFTDPEELRDAVAYAKNRGHAASITLDEVPIKPAPPAGVPLDGERRRASRQGR